MVTSYGLRVIGAIISLIAGWLLARLFYRAILRARSRSIHIDRTVTFFLANFARYGVLLLTFVAVRNAFGIAAAASSPSWARWALPSASRCRERDRRRLGHHARAQSVP